MNRFIKYIVIHCTAGHSSPQAVQDYFLRPKSKGGRGWKVGGYHMIIDYDGTIHQMYPFSQVTNGVAGFNLVSVHISYRGGVERDNVYKAADTRTDAQKEGILKAIGDVYRHLSQYQEVGGIKIRGHRDFSPDQNKSGIIEPHERIKECPSFDVIPEYAWIQGTEALNNPTLL